MRRLRDRGSTAGTRYTLRERMFSVGDDFWILAAAVCIDCRGHD